MVKAHISGPSRAEFIRTLKAFEKKKGRDIDESVLVLSKTCAGKLAHRVPAYGLSDRFGAKFKKSIAKQVMKAIRRGNIDGIPGSAKAVHEHYRVRGAVRGDFPPKKQFRRDPVPKNIVELLIRLRQSKAGRMKAGWIAAGEEIRGASLVTKSGRTKKIGGVGSWVRRHVSHSVGSGTILKRKGIHTTVRLHNRVGYVANVQKSRDISRALQLGFRQEFRRMKKKIEA